MLGNLHDMITPAAPFLCVCPFLCLCMSVCERDKKGEEGGEHVRNRV